LEKLNKPVKAEDPIILWVVDISLAKLDAGKRRAKQFHCQANDQKLFG
jgi:hypothetical protein